VWTLRASPFTYVSGGPQLKTSAPVRVVEAEPVAELLERIRQAQGRLPEEAKSLLETLTDDAETRFAKRKAEHKRWQPLPDETLKANRAWLRSKLRRGRP
jgi:hypothetical protein